MVETILVASYTQLMADAYEPAQFAQMLPVITKANPTLLTSDRYFVALADGAPAGCGGWSFERPGTGVIEPGLGHVRHLGVHPEHTGKGVGRALWEACVADAASADVTRFECYASLNAERFYAALGFEAAEPIDVPMGSAGVMPSLLMRWQAAD